MKEHASAALLSKLEVIRNLSTDTWMMQFPPQALRDVLTAVKLQQISGGKLIWRGRRVDAALLLEMLEREDGSGQWLARARILCSPPILALLDLTDSEAARVLGEVGRHAKKAEDKARQQRWLEAGDLIASCNFWKLSCQLSRVPALLANLRAQYACSTQAAVQTLFAAEKHGIDEQLILCHLATRPPAFGFLTHEQFAAQRYGELYATGIKVAEMLFWKRLRRALSTGPWWFGRIWWIVGGWGTFALLFAFVKPGPGWLVVGFIPALIALGMRALLVANIQPLLSIHFPKAPSWKFMDGPARCDAARNELRSTNELSAILNEINSDIAKLTALQPPPARIITPPRFMGLQATALCSWLVLLALLGYVGWQASIKPPSLEAFMHGWASRPENLEQLAEQGEEKEREETRIVWPHTRAPSELRVLTPLEQRAPTRQQEAQALRAGRALLAKFLPNTITVPVLVQLPSEKHFVYALYDGRKGGLASKNLVVLATPPMPRSWVEIDGRKVFVYVD
jgi:hypothetical protein